MSHTQNPCSGFSWRMQDASFWRASIMLTGTLAVALMLAALASGLVLLLLPVFVVGAVAYRVMGRPRQARRQEKAPYPESNIIEGEFVVISDEPANDRTPPLGEGPRRKPEP
jgi:hypothetical protein